MGLTFVDITIRKSQTDSESRAVRCLMDSGATYTVVPQELRFQLGIQAADSVMFELADGSTIARPTGWMWVEFDGHAGYSPVAFGQPGDSELLGVLTLENLRLWLDPLHRELHPQKQTLKMFPKKGR